MIRECPLNRVDILKKSPSNFRYNIAIYKLNVYKISTKQHQLIYTWAQSSLRIKLRQQYYFVMKNWNAKNSITKIFLFLGDSYKVVMTGEWFIEK